MKTETRKLADQIHRLTGASLVLINLAGRQYVSMGLCKTQIEALEQILSDIENMKTYAFSLAERSEHLNNLIPKGAK
jgi:hypothetical protein